ncbi:MAG TPA: YtxH domain-containing protein [Chthonomonadaceae bacterium]|nr:YtxH domain-containing protein [Chthonomonadaceae bacterium]
MENRGSNAGYGLMMFFLGACVGAAVALLYAPQEGEAMRRTIGEKANEYKDKASEVTSNVAQTAKEKWSQASDRVSEMLHRGQQMSAEAIDTAAEKAKQATSDTLNRASEAAESMS